MIEIDCEHLTLDEVYAIANGEKARLAKSAAAKIKKSRSIVEKLVGAGKPIYGVNTGFGELANVRIKTEDAKQLQRNLILSHACGVGAPLSQEVVRAMICLRANALAKGFSGVRLEVVQTLVEMLNKNVVPVIPEQGSVGASGDLVPLAHLALVIIGEGEATFNGKRMSGAEAMKSAGIAPLELMEKEGLALINGTQMMCALGVIALKRAEALLKNAQIAAAASAEALKGTDQAFRAEIHELRPHKGQIAVADNMRRLTRNSEIVASHRDCPKVQDAYSIRCIPQVLGASKDAIGYVRGVLETEINSATDNPLIFDFGAISGGNFHGQPLALALDFLGIAVAEIADISERRIARLVDSKLSGLPPFLAEKGGLNSGLMIPQYPAASLVSENKVLAHPASVDSIPTSANMEDHVSMGGIAARKALKITENAENVVAIEYLCAAQALDFHKMKAGKGTQAAHEAVRKSVAHVGEDRVLAPDMQKIREMMLEGKIAEAVEKKVGKLK